MYSGKGQGERRKKGRKKNKNKGKNWAYQWQQRGGGCVSTHRSGRVDASIQQLSRCGRELDGTLRNLRVERLSQLCSLSIRGWRQGRIDPDARIHDEGDRRLESKKIGTQIKTNKRHHGKESKSKGHYSSKEILTRDSPESEKVEGALIAIAIEEVAIPSASERSSMRAALRRVRRTTVLMIAHLMFLSMIRPITARRKQVGGGTVG